ncbi:MAG: transglutaminase TgpA family protein [Chloroflexota bacterium]
MRSARWWDWAAALLLFAAVFCAVGRLIVTDWVDDLDVVLTLAFLASVTGLALGQSRFSPGVAAAFALIYGLFAILWRIGLTLEVPEDALWVDRLVVLGTRVSNAVAQLAGRQPVQDPLPFLIGMGTLFWALSVDAGYTMTRSARPWRIIVPTGLVAVVIQAADPYRPSRTWYVAAYFFFSLLIQARLVYLRRRSDWYRDETHVSPYAALDFTHIVLIATALLIVLAWTVPSMAEALPTARAAWHRAARPWGERLEDVFASLRLRGATVTVADYYSAEFSLGRGRKLSDSLVLTVQGPVGEAGRVRTYWRARVYDEYADGRWETAALTVTKTVRPTGSGLDFPDLEGRRPVSFTFTAPEPIKTLYVAPQPRWVDRPVEVDLADNPDGTVDVAALHAPEPLSGGDSYRAGSSVSDVTIRELREAGTDYPQWVTDRYLQLPPTITPRTRELAETIAGDLETPYDVAGIVTEYLRRRIRYTETITDSLPVDQEPLDWFLFDLGQGFCNYYASAEVVLLRSLGVPARLAVGFAQGERQAASNTYIVRQHNAHAWPEVYFPGIGWVEFEPTVSEEPIGRPSGEPESESAEGGAQPYLDERWRERFQLLEEVDEFAGERPPAKPERGVSMVELLNRHRYGILVVVGVVLIVLFWRARRRWDVPPWPVVLETGVRRVGLEPPGFLRRWASLTRMPPLERAYLEINRALARLGVAPDPTATPAEQTAALSEVLPVAAFPAERLLMEYQTTIYGRREGNLQRARDAAREVRRLSWRAAVGRLLGRGRVVLRPVSSGGK